MTQIDKLERARKKLQQVREWVTGSEVTPHLDPYGFLFGWDDRKGNREGQIDLIESLILAEIARQQTIGFLKSVIQNWQELSLGSAEACLEAQTRLSELQK